MWNSGSILLEGHDEDFAKEIDDESLNTYYDIFSIMHYGE